MDDRNSAGNAVLLDPEQTDRLLNQFKVPTVPQRVVYSPEPEDAVRAAEEFGYPVVLKAFTPTLVHKSDVGGVRMFLHDDHQVERAAMAIQERVPDLVGYLLQSQAPGGHEVVIECTREPGFGAVVQVGLGGGWADLVGDVSVRIAPIDRRTAREMIDELRGAPLLSGHYGARTADIDALVEMLVNVGRLVVETPQVAQVDVNPAIAGTNQVVAVDTRIFWDESAQTATPPSTGPEEDRLAAMQRLLSPRSIAVVGSMEDPASPASRLMESLIAGGFEGELHPVDPYAAEPVDRSIVRSLSALTTAPDLACITVPPERMAEEIRACGASGIRSAIVYPAGEAEDRDELIDAVRESGVYVCGPGSAGVLNPGSGLHAAIDLTPPELELRAGEISLLTQSGTLGSWLLGQALASGAGVRHWIDTGQELDLTLSDELRVLVDDPETRVIAIYLETLHDPAGFMRAAGQARESGKSIIVYRSGALGTDGRPARADHAMGAAFRAAGVAQAQNLQTLSDATLALAWQPVPRGSGVGVITSSGGARDVIAAEVSRSGLSLPALDERTIERLREIDPPVGARQNPLHVGSDLARQPDVVDELAGALLNDNTVHAVILVLPAMTGETEEMIARRIGAAARSSGKPVLISSTWVESRQAFRDARLPVYSTPDRAVSAVRAMVDIGADR